MDIGRLAKEQEQYIIDCRRYLHAHPEVGEHEVETTRYIVGQLEEQGIPVQIFEGITGCVATIEGGQPGKTVMLRADIDALPIQENPGKSYCSVNPGVMHACGHDCHTAMLLGAAKALKEMEGELKGTVKFMFQSAEELLGGAAAMIEAGLLENPKVDAAFGLHVAAGLEDSYSGTVRCTHGTMNRSGDAIKVTVTGRDAHGSTPERGIDAISIAARIVLALEELVAKEIPSKEDSVVLVGKIAGGTTCNSVAGSAVLEISVRTEGHEERAFLKRRVKEIAQGIAAVYRGSAEVEYQYGMPPLVNHEDMMNEFIGYMNEFLPEGSVREVPGQGGCEDFTMVCERVPAIFLMLGAGDKGSGYEYSMHHPSMRVDENALPVGTEVYVNCAVRWLEEH